MKPGENIQDMETRFYNVVNHLASLGKVIPNDLVNKVLRSLSRKMAAQSEVYSRFEKPHSHELGFIIQRASRI